MNNEIKEIIEYFKDDIDFLEVELKYPNFKGRYITIRDKECEYLRKLLDYITNLQEENESLKELCNKYEEEHNTTFKIWKKDLKNFEHEKNRELKSRIDKAIEELDKYINSCEIEAEHTLNNEKCLISVNHSKKVKNILQGNKWNEVERAYLDDKPIGSDKE